MPGCVPETYEDKVDRAHELEREMFVALCGSCFQRFEYESQFDCIDDYTAAFPEGYEECLHEAYRLDEVAGELHLDCTISARERYIACLGSSDCNDDSAFFQCFEDLEAARELCLVPERVESYRVDNCF
jgi:hypothetical protein